MIEPVPYFQPTPMRCRCGHKWVGHLPCDVPAKVWLAHIKVLRCPTCGHGPSGIYLCGDRAKADGA